MRDPYVELGIGIVGQAIRDWRVEGKACKYNTKKSGRIKKITEFFKSELASVILTQIDVDPILLLENLQKENREKWIELELEKLGREKDDDKGRYSDRRAVDE